jgi:hypothetical protein
MAASIHAHNAAIINATTKAPWASELGVDCKPELRPASTASIKAMTRTIIRIILINFMFRL